MNKRYIDFVPPKSTTNSTASGTKTTKAAPSYPRTTTTSSHSKSTKTSQTVGSTRRVVYANTYPTDQVNFTTHTSQKVELGVIEDLSPKFINTNTPKRPLNSNKNTTSTKQSNDSLKEAKSQKTIARKTKLRSSASKTSRKEAKTTATSNPVSQYKPPKTPFVNLDKITKRPLSKNVYTKKVETPSEVPKGPVTIITKPEKDSHIGLIITIILTIILGAAAGTVAFLLLPK